jgi:hypothetical protein
MLWKNTTLTFSLILVCAIGAVGQGDFQNGVEVTTLKAPWILRILGQEIDISDVQAKPDQTSAYFMMSSEVTKLNVSVFIEPVDKCKTTEACRDYVLGLGNPDWGKYQDLEKGTLGSASYFQFYRPQVKGAPVNMLDMYAEFVKDGYWVDMHISKVMYEKKDHELFERVVNSSMFVPKASNQSTPFDVQLAKAQRGTETWLLLWDTLKCKESYTAMSTTTRKDLSEKDWVDYCKTYAGGLGKNNSRKLIAAAFTSSTDPKTDRPLAILAYQADFKKKSGVVELVGLLLEKDGGWVVTNHLLQ